MFTPQQIDQISFTQARKGYNMEEVDAFLEPLTEDYVTLYKENALLKSKMRVLVGKLEEYRKSEAGMKDAMVNAQRTCDRMVREAEEKCARMLKEAGASEVHVRIASPQIKAPCFYGVDISTYEELLCAHKSLEEVRVLAVI